MGNSLANAENMTQIAYEAIKMKLFVNEIKPDQKINYRELAQKHQHQSYPGDSGLSSGWSFRGWSTTSPTEGFIWGRSAWKRSERSMTSAKPWRYHFCPGWWKT